MVNSGIRKLKSETGVEWPPVADYLKISEGTLFRWLRHPMDAQRRKLVEEAIREVGKKENRGCD